MHIRRSMGVFVSTLWYVEVMLDMLGIHWGMLRVLWHGLHLLVFS